MLLQPTAAFSARRLRVTQFGPAAHGCSAFRPVGLPHARVSIMAIGLDPTVHRDFRQNKNARTGAGGENPNSFLPHPSLSSPDLFSVRFPACRRRPATAPHRSASPAPFPFPFPLLFFLSLSPEQADEDEATAPLPSLSPVVRPLSGGRAAVERRGCRSPLPLAGLIPSSDASACRCALDREGWRGHDGGALCRRARGPPVSSSLPFALFFFRSGVRVFCGGVFSISFSIPNGSKC